MFLFLFLFLFMFMFMVRYRIHIVSIPYRYGILVPVRVVLIPRRYRYDICTVSLLPEPAQFRRPHVLQLTFYRLLDLWAAWVVAVIREKIDHPDPTLVTHDLAVRLDLVQRRNDLLYR